MVRDESKEVASSQIMEMLVSEIQGDTEKGMWGELYFIHTKFELADKYPCGTIRSELGIQI